MISGNTRGCTAVMHFTLVLQATLPGTWSQEPLYSLHSLSESRYIVYSLVYERRLFTRTHVDLSYSTPSNPDYPLVQEDKFSGSNNPTQSTNCMQVDVWLVSTSVSRNTWVGRA